MNADTTSENKVLSSTSDLKELLGDSVTNIKTKLADLSAIELMMLVYFEKDREGGARSTLLEHLDQELDQRAEADGAERQAAIQDMLDTAANKHSSEIDDLKKDFAEQLKNKDEAIIRAEESEKKAEQDRVTLKAERDKALGDLKAQMKSEKTIEKPQSELPEAFIAKVRDGDFTEAKKVVFIDVNKLSIVELPALSFRDSNFIDRPNRRSLMQPIEFDGRSPSLEIAGAALVDDEGVTVSICTFRVPISVGSGRKAILPKGTLAFPAPEVKNPVPASK